MADEKINGQREQTRNLSEAVRIVIAIGAGLVGTAGYIHTKPPRPDPWTATQAREAHNDIKTYFNEKIGEIRILDRHLQEELQVIRERVYQLPPKELLERIRNIEVRLDQHERYIHRGAEIGG